MPESTLAAAEGQVTMTGGGPPHGLKEEQNLGPQEIRKQIRYTLTGYATVT